MYVLYGIQIRPEAILRFEKVSGQTHLPTHVVFKCESLPKESMVMLEQRFTFDKSRLKRYLGRLPAEYIPLVDRAIKIQDGVLDKESMKQFALERKRRREKSRGKK